MSRPQAPPNPGPSFDDKLSKEDPDGAPAKVLALLEDASAFAADGDMESIERVLAEVMAVVRQATPPLSTSAWDEVRRRQARLQQEVDAAGERIRSELGLAGGGRRAANRYGQLAPTPVDEGEGEER
jgi:hypothetical protein